MKKTLTIQSKLLILGLLPLGLISILFLFALSMLESRSLWHILENDQVSFERVWEQIIKDEGQFLEFSGVLIRQDQQLLKALKTVDSTAIEQQSSSVWNQLKDRVDSLFFWNQSVPQRRLLHWIAKVPGTLDIAYTNPLLEQVASTRRSVAGLARFPDGRLRLMHAAAYFNAPGKPYNLVAQGVALDPLAERLKKLIGVASVRVVDAPLTEPEPIHINEQSKEALFHLVLYGVDGVSIGYLEIRKALSNIMDAFTWAKRAAMMAPGLLIILTAIAILLFIRWLVKRFVALQMQLAAIAQGQVEPIVELEHPDELDHITYGLYQQGHRLEETHRKLILAKDQRALEAESRLTLNRMLETSLLQVSLTEQMELLLEILFSVSWFSLDARGSIFLIDTRTNELVLKAQRGFGPELQEKCGRFAVGHCLCGQTVETGRTIFASNSKQQNKVFCERESDYGHYCLSIKGTQAIVGAVIGGVMGVINLYVMPNHVRRLEEDEFLESVAVTISGLIERRQLEDLVKQQAEFDDLTSLPNRSLFHARLSREILIADRSKNELVLMFIDLDRFKQVNDTLGHKAGDKLLQEASRRIGLCVRASDTVARLGGDEFTVIMPKLTPEFCVEFVARRIIESLSEPFQLPEGEVDISCSIGISVYPNDDDDIDRLIMNADTAMYVAKREGRSTFRFFKAEMNIQAMRRLELEKALKIALEENQLTVFYQPKVQPTTGRVLGMEALARWIRPGLGMVPPSEFIPIAEQTGLILPIGERILERACEQNKKWLDAGLGPMVISVNLSPRQFKLGEKLVHMVVDILERTGLPAHLLELEITESMMLDDMKEAIVLLNKIRDLGVNISVDDFGTGYSSLSMLKHLPIKTLKIDRSFITDLSSNDDSATIVSTIIALAKQLNMRVVAEGVEQEAEMLILRNQGCDEIQGYYYSKPCPSKEFEAYLHSIIPDAPVALTAYPH